MKPEYEQLLDNDAAYQQQSNEEHRRYVEEMDKDKKIYSKRIYEYFRSI